MKSKRPRGRPPAPPDKARRLAVGWRTNREFKAKLVVAAELSGRSLAQECEHLIELGMIFETLMALGQQRLFEEWKRNRNDG
jgi:hypothetical protein